MKLYCWYVRKKRNIMYIELICWASPARGAGYGSSQVDRYASKVRIGLTGASKRSSATEAQGRVTKGRRAYRGVLCRRRRSRS